MNNSYARFVGFPCALAASLLIQSCAVVPYDGYGNQVDVGLGLGYYEPGGAYYGGWGPSYRVGPYHDGDHHGGDHDGDRGGNHRPATYRPAPASHSTPSIPSGGHGRGGGGHGGHH